MNELLKLYSQALPSNRKGALYNAFSYPTKISPEAIAIYIACHTKVGDLVLDPFSGSGTTGLATLLCDRPTEVMLKTAQKLGVNPVWGKRQAILYELSSLGSFISKVMCNPPSSKQFRQVAENLISSLEEEIGGIYEIKDPENNKGTLRYAIWSEMLICPSCKKEISYWESAVSKNPLTISSGFRCSECKHEDILEKVERVQEKIIDPLLNKIHYRKKRIPVWIYGTTNKKKWDRKATAEEGVELALLNSKFSLGEVPNYKMNWGVLYRKGYHSGISHVHHFYSDRNLIVFSRLWQKTNSYSSEINAALKLLLLSYNSSHATLMSRVVVKQKNKDFVTTGAQSGVLYISNLPVEKNIFDGVRRKIKILADSFMLVEGSKSTVTVFNQSSTKLSIENNSVNYVFADPPFGDYIPYSEINQINEAWLGRITDNSNEVIINLAQKKGINQYSTLLTQVFSETHRVLKSNGHFSLVFHSAKAEIWQALVSAYTNSGFQVSLSNILDKVQGSFKQVTSTVRVQGDPLVLLTKCENKIGDDRAVDYKNEHDIIESIITYAYVQTNDASERQPERLFSRYVTACLQSNIVISLGAKEFNQIIKKEVSKLCLVDHNG